MYTWCNDGQKLAQTNIIEARFEATGSLCYIPRAAKNLEKAKAENRTKECLTCGEVFSVRIKLKYSTGCIYLILLLGYFQIHCEKDRAQFVRHMQSHKENFTCTTCQSTFDTKNKLAIHTKLTHKTGFLKCVQCAVVINEKIMPKHMEKYHTECVCDICGAFYK